MMFETNINAYVSTAMYVLVYVTGSYQMSIGATIRVANYLLPFWLKLLFCGFRCRPILLPSQNSKLNRMDNAATLRQKGGKQATLIIAGNRLVKSRHLGLSAVSEPYLAVFVILQVARNFPRRTVTTFQSSIVHSVQFTILWKRSSHILMYLYQKSSLFERYTVKLRI